MLSMRVLPVLLVLIGAAYAFNSIHNQQWVIYDATKQSQMFGNPSYGGSDLGAPFLPNNTWVNDVQFGLSHVIALSSDGNVWGWGDQPAPLGLPATQPTDTSNTSMMYPTAIFTGGGFIAVGASGNASIAIRGDGTAFWAGTFSTESGSTVTTGYANWTPILVNSNSSVGLFSSVKCGLNHCILQDSAGYLYGLGANDLGQIDWTTNDLYSSAAAVVVPFSATPYVASTGLYCTGVAHTVFVGANTLYAQGACDAVAPNSTCAVLTLAHAVPMGILAATINGSFIQVACGAYHTIARTDAGNVYGFGNNAGDQAVPFASVDFVYGMYPVYPLGSFTRPVYVAYNSTVAQTASGGWTGWGVAGDLPLATNSTISNNITLNTAKKPSWLKMHSIAGATGSPIRPTFALEFQEDADCADDRPFYNAVCWKGWWCSQRSMQLASSQPLSAMALESPFIIFGDLVVSENSSLSFSYPSDLSDVILNVTGCAQLQGDLNLALTQDNLTSIQEAGGSITIKLIQANCSMYSSSSSVAGAKRDIEANLRVHLLLEEESTAGPTAAPVEAPYADGSSTPINSTVPDVAAGDATPASGSSSTSRVFLSPVSGTPISALSSSCSSTTVSTQQQANSDGTTTLLAVLSVTSGGCNTPSNKTMIIAVTVSIGGVVVLAIAAAIIILSVPKLKLALLPYRGAKL